MLAVVIAVCLAAVGEIMLLWFVWPERSMRGRHVSKPIVKRIGKRRASNVCVGLCWCPGVLNILGAPLVAQALFAVLFVVWLADDILTGGDKPKKKRRKLGVTIRMPSLRPFDYGIAAGH